MNIQKMTKKFDNMKLNDSKLIRKDISIKNLNSKFQKMEIGKKRTRASKVIKPKKKRKKNVTDVVLYDENFINNLFSIMDTIKKDRKYDINSVNNKPNIKIDNKYSVELVSEQDNSLLNDYNLEYDSNAEIDGYATDEDFDLYKEDYDY
tara:strand:- start:17233 stop:17679 length:447 start_codon:yes stop_codon:yes gene_type:complete